MIISIQKNCLLQFKLAFGATSPSCQAEWDFPTLTDWVQRTVYRTQPDITSLNISTGGKLPPYNRHQTFLLGYVSSSIILPCIYIFIVMSQSCIHWCKLMMADGYIYWTILFWIYALSVSSITVSIPKYDNHLTAAPCNVWVMHLFFRIHCFSDTHTVLI